MKTTFTDSLSHNSSPYLQQHHEDLINWYPWGEDAFSRARSENKPIFLSIGYSTCYWCHVMAKDSFNSPDIAGFLNEFFISIKVDREERPDVDHLYMEAVVALTGNGGWPLTLFLNHQLAPFWGGTFFYREQFLHIIKQIKEAWDQKRQLVDNSAKELSHSSVNSLEQERRPLQDIISTTENYLISIHDQIHGGFGDSPKFPPHNQLEFLLRINRASEKNEIKNIIINSLKNILCGGIYDQIGGGLHRYSVDRQWIIPHFEKMLYDNALFVRVLLIAYQRYKEPIFAIKAREILEWINREMTSDEGAFYTALDAGDVGVEGNYYTWSIEELTSILQKADLDLFQEIFDLGPHTLMENERHVLNLSKDKLEITKSDPVLNIFRNLLLTRKDRQRPHRDEKILTGLNGLMLGTFAHAGLILKEQKYIESAYNCLSFIRSNLINSNGRLSRRYYLETSGITAMLEDYAYLIDGCLSLYNATLDTDIVYFANKLQQEQNNYLWDDKDGGYFTHQNNELYRQSKVYNDSALPSANSVSLTNLYRLASLMREEGYSKMASQMVNWFQKNINPARLSSISAVTSLVTSIDGIIEIEILPGSESSYSGQSLPEKINETYIPPHVIVSSSLENERPLPSAEKPVNLKRTTYNICRQNTCFKSTTEVEELISYLNDSL